MVQPHALAGHRWRRFDLVSRPSWQIGLEALGSVPDMREVPDVAADADPVTGNTIVVGGALETGGGTSLSSPIWAGFTSLIDEFLHTSGAPHWASPILSSTGSPTRRRFRRLRSTM